MPPLETKGDTSNTRPNPFSGAFPQLTAVISHITVYLQATGRSNAIVELLIKPLVAPGIVL